MDTIIIFKEIDMNIGFKDSIKPIDAEQGFYLKDYLRDAYESVSGYTLIGYASANEVVYLFHLIGEHLVINNNLVLLSKSSQGV